MCLLWYEKLAGIFHFSVTLTSMAYKLLHCISVHTVCFLLADCLSARREEVKMWGIINRIWQGVSSKPMLQMFDKMSVRVTGVVCLLSFALLFLLFEVVGSWSSTKTGDPQRPTEFDTCLDVSFAVLFASQGERQRTNSKLQGSLKHKRTVPVSQQASLHLLCTQFKHSPLLWLICSSPGIVDLFVVIVVLFSQRE